MASKIPKWFDAWLLKQKNKQSMRAAGTRFFWEIICWCAYTKGKRAGIQEGVAIERERVIKIMTTLTPRNKIVKPKRT